MFFGRGARSALSVLVLTLGGTVTGILGAAAPGSAALASSTCGSWPLVGRDLANTRSGTGGPGASQVLGLKTLWRFQAADGDFTGTPVFADCTVFVGSNGGVVRALDEQTGAVRWSQKLQGPIPSSLAVDRVDNTPDGLVFVAGALPGHPFVTGIDERTGAVAWSTTISSQPDADAYGSPLFVRNVPFVFAGSTTPTPTDVVFEGVASAVTSETSSATDTTRGQLVALDAATGAVLWSIFTVPVGDNGGAIWSTPSYDPATNTLYVGTGNAYSGTAAKTTDSILAIDASTGAIARHFQATGGDVFGMTKLTGPDFDFGASPNLVTAGGVPAVGAGQKAGVYWMLRRSTLTPIWSATVARGSAFGGVVGSTAADGRRVYGPNTLPGYSWALNQSNGALVWIDPSLDPLHYGPATVSNGVLYTEDSYGFLDCVAASTGLLLNRLPLNGVADLLQGTYAEAYGGVSVDGANGLVFADTGSQSTHGDVIALVAGSGLP